MNLSQTLRDERNELRIVSFTGLKTDASVAVFCRKQRCAQNFFFGQRVSADNVIVFADTAVTAVNRADIRDFRGVNANAFDGRGNYALGVKEQLIFPEIEYEKVDRVRGMDIIFVTTAKTDEEAKELLKLLGMPFKN